MPARRELGVLVVLLEFAADPLRPTARVSVASGCAAGVRREAGCVLPRSRATSAGSARQRTLAGSTRQPIRTPPPLEPFFYLFSLGDYGFRAGGPALVATARHRRLGSRYPGLRRLLGWAESATGAAGGHRHGAQPTSPPERNYAPPGLQLSPCRGRMWLVGRAPRPVALGVFFVVFLMRLVMWVLFL